MNYWIALKLHTKILITFLTVFRTFSVNLFIFTSQFYHVLGVLDLKYFLSLSQFVYLRDSIIIIIAMAVLI